MFKTLSASLLMMIFTVGMAFADEVSKEVSDCVREPKDCPHDTKPRMDVYENDTTIDSYVCMFKETKDFDTVNGTGIPHYRIRGETKVAAEIVARRGCIALISGTPCLQSIGDDAYSERSLCSSSDYSERDCMTISMGCEESTDEIKVDKLVKQVPMNEIVVVYPPFMNF